MKATDPNDDLSNYHEPLTKLFRFNGPETDFRLSSSELAKFEEHGFVTGVQILDEDQVSVMRRELELLADERQRNNPLFYEYHRNESKDPGKILFHALGAWRVSPAFHDLIYNPALTVPASQLLGGPVRFWHDQLFVKPACDGAVVAWHQDYSYWTRTKPMAHLTCWIGLDDSDEENGCLHYVPGSHKWDLLPRSDLANNMEAVLGLLSPEQLEAFKPMPVILKAGEASFHHPMMVHGSYENRSQRPRRATVINFIRDGVRSDSDEPLLAGTPAIPAGEKIDGQFFPLLRSEDF